MSPPASPKPATTAAEKAGHSPVSYALLAFLGITWGSSFLLIKVALSTITPVTLASVRIFLAALILMFVARAAGEKLPRDRRVWIRFAFLGFTGQALPFVLINSGQNHVDSSLGSILQSSTPLFTLLLAHIFTDDHISPRKLAGVCLGFAGIFILIGPSALAGTGSSLFGQLLIVGGAFCYATTNVTARRLSTQGLSPLVSSTGSLICAFLWTVPMVPLMEEPWTLRPDLLSILCLILLALFSTALATLAFFRLARTDGPNFISLNNYLIPLVGVAWGVSLLGERFSLHIIAAMAIILCGVAVATSRRRTSAK